jgi:hypothetical protein
MFLMVRSEENQAGPVHGCHSATRSATNHSIQKRAALDLGCEKYLYSGIQMMLP